MAQKESDSASGVESVKRHISDDVLESADEAGVDVDEIIEAKLEKHGEDYGAKSVARFATAAIESQVEAESAEVIKGIIMGSRDRYGKNWPRRHSILRSSGDHIEVSTWDGELPDPSGTDKRIPEGGAIVELAVNHNAEYDDYEGARINDVTQLSTADMVDEVGKVASQPDDVTRSMEYETVAVSGEIRYVDPQTIFEGGEPQGDGPVLMKDDRGDHQPHVEFTLERYGDTVVRGHIERQSYGKPFIKVPDLGTALADAYEAGEPSEQASFLQTFLRGEEVIVVGNVNKFDTNRDDEGNVTRYVDIAVTALVSLDAGERAAEAVSETEEEDTTSGSDETSDDSGATESAESAEEENGADYNSVDVAEVRDDIEEYANLTGEDTESLTVEDLTGTLDHADSAIREALKGEVPDTDDGEDDPWAKVREDGVYHCPVDDCLVQESSKESLKGHVGSDHDISPDELEKMVRGEL